MYTYPYVDFFSLNTAEKRVIHNKVKNLILDGSRTKNIVVRLSEGYKIVEINASNLNTLNAMFSR